MTTVELDMRRMELIRDIMDTDSIEVLDKVKRAFKRAVKSVQTEAYGPVPGIPHTIEEVKADIAEFEREWDEGTSEGQSHLVPGNTAVGGAGKTLVDVAEAGIEGNLGFLAGKDYSFAAVGLGISDEATHHEAG